MLIKLIFYMCVLNRAECASDGVSENERERERELNNITM